ncbi:hypothetical protein Tco_0227684 [Tanacetum coccineum]
MLYDGSVIAKETNVISIADSEDTLMLEEESRSKILLKQSDLKVNIKPIKYAELNQLSKDFCKRFVSQQELSDEAFLLQTLHPNTDQSASLPIKIKAPQELPKIMPDALTKGEWGFMFDARHALCFLKFVADMNASSKSKITTTNKVPLREPIPLEVVTQESVVTKVYTRRPKVVQIVLWYLDSGCSKHMTRDRSQLTNFVHKFLDTVKFGNDQIAKIMRFRRFNNSRVQNEKIYNHVKDVVVKASHVIRDAVTKSISSLFPLFVTKPTLSLTIMGDENSNRHRTLGDYSRPSHEGYRNTIELPEGAKISPLRSDTIRLVQNGCAFHRRMSEDQIQHLKDFIKIVDSIDVNGAIRNTTRLRLFCFTLRDQAINWLDRLPARSISTWDDLTTRLIRKVPHHGLDLWLEVQIFYDHVNYTTQMAIDDAVGGRLRKLRPEEAWKTIEDLAQYEEEEWNDPTFFEKGSPDYIDATLE